MCPFLLRLFGKKHTLGPRGGTCVCLFIYGKYNLDKYFVNWNSWTFLSHTQIENLCLLACSFCVTHAHCGHKIESFLCGSVCVWGGGILILIKIINWILSIYKKPTTHQLKYWPCPAFCIDLIFLEILEIIKRRNVSVSLNPQNS